MDCLGQRAALHILIIINTETLLEDLLSTRAGCPSGSYRTEHTDSNSSLTISLLVIYDNGSAHHIEII